MYYFDATFKLYHSQKANNGKANIVSFFSQREIKFDTSQIPGNWVWDDGLGEYPLSVSESLKTNGNSEMISKVLEQLKQFKNLQVRINTHNKRDNITYYHFNGEIVNDEEEIGKIEKRIGTLVNAFHSMEETKQIIREEFKVDRKSNYYMLYVEDMLLSAFEAIFIRTIMYKDAKEWPYKDQIESFTLRFFLQFRECRSKTKECRIERYPCYRNG